MTTDRARDALDKLESLVRSEASRCSIRTGLLAPPRIEASFSVLPSGDVLFGLRTPGHPDTSGDGSTLADAIASALESLQ